MKLDDAARAALMRDGYVVVPDALDRAWVDRLLLAFPSTQTEGTQHVTLATDTPERSSWSAVRDHPILLEAAHLVLGESFHVAEPHGRNPLPGYGQQGLHPDWRPRPTVEPFIVLTTIWMLDDFTRKNGPTRVVPGSFRLTNAVPKELAQPTAHHPKEIFVTGKAGSALLLNGHTWHSGTKNESTGPRRAIQLLVHADGAFPELT